MKVEHKVLLGGRPVISDVAGTGPACYEGNALIVTFETSDAEYLADFVQNFVKAKQQAGFTAVKLDTNYRVCISGARGIRTKKSIPSAVQP